MLQSVIENKTNMPTPNHSTSPLDTIRQGYRSHRVIGSFLLAAAVYSTVKSGGVIDHAIDPFQNADSVVQEAWELDPTPIEDREFDNIPFSYYSPDAQAEWRADEQDTVDAANRVARTMSDLDGHRYDDIQERADAFRQSQGNNIMPTEQTVATLEQIESSTDFRQVAGALDIFMNFYGKDAGLLRQDLVNLKKFDPSVDLDSVKRVSEDIVEALSYLPKGIIADAQFTDLKLAGSSGTLLGQYYKGRTQELGVTVPSRMASKLFSAGNALPNFIQDPQRTKTDILHELTHANDGLLTGSTPASDNAKIFKQIGKDMVGRPDYVTHYATTSFGEEAAENTSAALNIERGPTHPDAARRFGSEANKGVLTKLAAFEANYPGITDYLVNLNKGLMNK